MPIRIAQTPASSASPNRSLRFPSCEPRSSRRTSSASTARTSSPSNSSSRLQRTSRFRAFSHKARSSSSSRKGRRTSSCATAPLSSSPTDPFTLSTNSPRSSSSRFNRRSPRAVSVSSSLLGDPSLAQSTRRVPVRTKRSSLLWSLSLRSSVSSPWSIRRNTTLAKRSRPAAAPEYVSSWVSRSHLRFITSFPLFPTDTKAFF